MCTVKKQHLFGDIRNGMMGLSEWGCVVAQELQNTEKIRPYVHLDSWIIMPNHVHVIFQIDHHIDMPVGALSDNAPTREFRLQSQSLGAIVGQFKRLCTKTINALYDDHGIVIWQRNYHEHVIRNETECIRIRRYIRNNPLNWDIDPENI